MRRNVRDMGSFIYTPRDLAPLFISLSDARAGQVLKVMFVAFNKDSQDDIKEADFHHTDEVVNMVLQMIYLRWFDIYNNALKKSEFRKKGKDLIQIAPPVRPELPKNIFNDPKQDLTGNISDSLKNTDFMKIANLKAGRSFIAGEIDLDKIKYSEYPFDNWPEKDVRYALNALNNSVKTRGQVFDEGKLCNWIRAVLKK